MLVFGGLVFLGLSPPFFPVNSDHNHHNHHECLGKNPGYTFNDPDYYGAQRDNGLSPKLMAEVGSLPSSEMVFMLVSGFDYQFCFTFFQTSCSLPEFRVQPISLFWVKFGIKFIALNLGSGNASFPSSFARPVPLLVQQLPVSLKPMKENWKKQNKMANSCCSPNKVEKLYITSKHFEIYLLPYEPMVGYWQYLYSPFPKPARCWTNRLHVLSLPVACHGGIALRGDIELSKDSKALLAIRLSQKEAAKSQGMNFQSTGGLVVQ